MQENARAMCDSLKADVSALKRLSDTTFEQMPADVASQLGRAADEHKQVREQLEKERARMQAQLEEVHRSTQVQLEEERRSTQTLLEKERAAMHVQLEARCCIGPID